MAGEPLVRLDLRRSSPNQKAPVITYRATLDVPRELAQGSLRLTTGIDNSPEDVEYALEVLEGCVAELRAATAVMS